MDIQKLVDSRIEELKAQAGRQEVIATNIGLVRGDDRGPSGLPPIENRDERRRAGRNGFRSAMDRSFEELPGFDPDDGFEVMEQALERVAEKVLGITEALAGDYIRLENEMLRSRLAILQSAETVLDMAISLRDRARQIVRQEGRYRRIYDDLAGPSASGHFMDEPDDLYFDSGRASMHRHGVAALFRKTQR